MYLRVFFALSFIFHLSLMLQYIIIYRVNQNLFELNLDHLHHFFHYFYKYWVFIAFIDISFICYYLI